MFALTKSQERGIVDKSFLESLNDDIPVPKYFLMDDKKNEKMNRHYRLIYQKKIVKYDIKKVSLHYKKNTSSNNQSKKNYIKGKRKKYNKKFKKRFLFLLFKARFKFYLTRSKRRRKIKCRIKKGKLIYSMYYFEDTYHDISDFEVKE